MRRKGLNTAIAVVVTIVVLLIIAIAVVTMTTGTISDLGSKSKEVRDTMNSKEIACNVLVSKEACISLKSSCKWDDDNNKCVPINQ